MRVFVYYNLHKKTWSVRSLEGETKGRVIAHMDNLSVLNATFKVSEAGRQRVLRDKKKNVHAGVVGELAGQLDLTGVQFPVSYNPYKAPTFVNKLDDSPVKYANAVAFNGRKVVASNSGIGCY